MENFLSRYTGLTLFYNYPSVLDLNVLLISSLISVCSCGLLQNEGKNYFWRFAN